MADITMCEGKNCPKKNNCYRHTANANPWRQSYFMVVPFDSEKKSCEHYWDNKEYKK